jgi:hypothetical protein
MILIFLKYFIDDLYDKKFQFNGEFYKIYIYYNSIDQLSTVGHSVTPA